MPVFSKGLLCGGGSRADGKRRTGCLAASDDEDDSPDAVCTGVPAGADAATPQLRSLNNADFEVQPGSSNATAREEDEGEDGFRFFLTLADLQLPDVEDFAFVEIEGEGEPRPISPEPAALEFEHADLTPEEPVASPSKKPLKRSAKSSCGRASSPKEEESLEEEGPCPEVPPPEVPPPPTPEPEEDFLILLTGLLAQDPPPPDDFRFFLTLHQAEAAT